MNTARPPQARNSFSPVWKPPAVATSEISASVHLDMSQALSRCALRTRRSVSVAAGKLPSVKVESRSPEREGL
jgi:hypothetical protein